jgi:hypothetical protein
MESRTLLFRQGHARHIIEQGIDNKNRITGTNEIRKPGTTNGRCVINVYLFLQPKR